MKNRTLLTIIAILAISTVTLAANKVTIESKTVGVGATGVEIGIFLENDEPLRKVTIPLVLRELDPGAFITALALDNNVTGSRINWVMNEVEVAWQFAEEGGNCKNGQPGGFGILSYSGGYQHPVASSPEGALLHRSSIFSPPLAPGIDVIPSMKLTVDVASVVGSFEIDSTCTGPASHLLFVSDSHQPIVPEFIKGTVNILECYCPYQGDIDGNGGIDAIDLAMVIDIVYFGAYDPRDPGCPTTRGDFNNDGWPDSIDLQFIIDVAFFGGDGPIDPCEVK